MRVDNQRFASERLRLQLNARCIDIFTKRLYPSPGGVRRHPPKNFTWQNLRKRAAFMSLCSQSIVHSAPARGFIFRSMRSQYKLG